MWMGRRFECEPLLPELKSTDLVFLLYFTQTDAHPPTWCVRKERIKILMA